MFGTLDLVRTTDWVTILPGAMMAREAVPGGLVINPLRDPALALDLVLIAANRRQLSAAAAAFQAVLREEMAKASAVWGRAAA
jgi:DNA-binding transcriptional LysR family regulator